jgi:hypothetical protein
MRSPCSLSLYPSVFDLLSVIVILLSLLSKIKEAYEITLLSVCPSVLQIFYAYEITLLSVYLCAYVSPRNFFVFCAVRVLSKDSRRVVRPRIS